MSTETTTLADLTTRALELIAEQIKDAKTPAITSSFQHECVVLTDMVRQIRPDIPVLFLETFHHFPQTLTYRDELAAQYGLNLVILKAPEPKIGLWKESTRRAAMSTRSDRCSRRSRITTSGSRRCAAISPRAART